MVSLNGTNITFLRSKNAWSTYSSRRGYQFRSAATEHVRGTFCQILHILLVGHIFVPFSSQYRIYNVIHASSPRYDVMRKLEFIAKSKISEDLGCFSFDFSCGW